jgi:hypothetical protein
MMLSSMFSPTKKFDKELLLDIIAIIETLIKVGDTNALDLAAKFGDTFTHLSNKINSHDYTQDDVSHYRIKKFMNLVK